MGQRISETARLYDLSGCVLEKEQGKCHSSNLSGDKRLGWVCASSFQKDHDDQNFSKWSRPVLRARQAIRHVRVDADTLGNRGR
jgi:hypothetical protein